MPVSTLLTEGYLYFFVFIWLIIATWLESSRKCSKYRKLYSLVTAFVFILIIGLRWETGTDWIGYKELFDETVIEWDYIKNVFHFEIGYVLLNVLVKFFTDNYSIFLLVDSCIAIGLLFFIIQKATSYPNISWLIFFANFMIIQFMGSNRRMIAMVLVLWMIYYIAKDEKIRAFFFVSLAATFHKSAVFNSIIYLFPKNLISLRKLLWIFVICMILGIMKIPMILVEYLVGEIGHMTHLPLLDLFIIYSEGEQDHLVLSTGNLALNTFFAVCKRGLFLSFYIIMLKRHTPDKITVWFYNVYVISICMYLLLVGSFFQIQSAYLAFAEIILIGRLYKFSNGKEKLLICILIIAFTFIQMKNALGIFPELYIPYKSAI